MINAMLRWLYDLSEWLEDVQHKRERKKWKKHIKKCVNNAKKVLISNGVPFGPINVVCSDWYIFDFGTEI